MAQREDSLLKFEAQLISLMDFNLSNVSCFSFQEEDGTDDTRSSSCECDQDEDFSSNIEDDEDSIVTTQSQAFQRLSKVRISANALLEIEKANLTAKATATVDQAAAQHGIAATTNITSCDKGQTFSEEED
jgi:hypothetical protein